MGDRGHPARRARAPGLEDDRTRLVSVVPRIEAIFVIEGRQGEPGRERLDRFFRLTGAEIVAATPGQVAIAGAASRHYRKSRHPAGLNLGDVFACALAKSTGEPLLFKGAHFARTDIASAA